MLPCVRCKAETELYENGVPICFGCSVRERSTQEVLETTANKGEAFRRFEAIVLQSPGHLPHADGVQVIKNAANELSVARKQMARAYDRLSTYLEQGIVPEDLKVTAKKAVTTMAAGVGAQGTAKRSSTAILLKSPKQR